MIIDRSSPNPIELKTRLYQLVAEHKISLLSMMSDMTETDEDQVRYLLEELVDEGALEGSFTSDGQRFFLFDVKISEAPVAPTKDEGYVIDHVDTKVPKFVFITGFVLLITGYIVRGLVVISEIMEQIGIGVLMLGLGVLAAGWLMYTRADPPSNIK